MSKSHSHVFIRRLSDIANTSHSTVIRDVKKDTVQILEDAAAIKDDTAQILEEIARLQSRLPKDATGGQTTEGRPNEMLQRYLDSLTSYAGTVRDLSTEDDVDSFWSPEATSRSQSFEEARSSFSSAPLNERGDVVKIDFAASPEDLGGLAQIRSEPTYGGAGQAGAQSPNVSPNDNNNQPLRQGHMDPQSILARDSSSTTRTLQIFDFYSAGTGNTPSKLSSYESRSHSTSDPGISTSSASSLTSSEAGKQEVSTQ